MRTLALKNLSANPSSKAHYSEKLTDLHLAVLAADFESVQRLVMQSRHLLKAKDSKGLRPLDYTRQEIRKQLMHNPILLYAQPENSEDAQITVFVANDPNDRAVLDEISSFLNFQLGGSKKWALKESFSKLDIFSVKKNNPSKKKRPLIGIIPNKR